MEPWYVTGAERRSWLHLCALIASFARHSPRAHLQVCDFGLAAWQRARLAERGVLVHRPAAVPESASWSRCFASMNHYRPHARTLVWIDPASLVVGPLAQVVSGLVRSWGPEPRVALVRDSKTPTFAEAFDEGQLARASLSGRRDFFDTRLVIARAPTLWRELALLAPRLARARNTHQIWLNLLVASQRIAVQPLDDRAMLRSHEACGRLLRQGSRLMDGDTPVVLIHPDGASTVQERIVSGQRCYWQRFDSPALAALQDAALAQIVPASPLRVTA